MTDITPHRPKGGRSGWLAYARILRSIHDGTDTTAELAAFHAMRRDGIREILRRMLSLGLVHIGGSAKATNNVVVPRWALGPGKVFFGTNAPLQPNTELIATANMLSAIQERPYTSKALADRCGLSHQRVADFMNGCVRDLRIAYIADYRNTHVRGSGTLAAAFAFGFDRPNVERRAPMPERVLNARSYAHKKARRLRVEKLVAAAANSSIFRLAQGGIQWHP